MRNQYAGGCSWCSVWVYAEGGFLSSGSDSGWRIECATCHWLLSLEMDTQFEQSCRELPPSVR